MKVIKEKKLKVSKCRKRKHKDKNLVGGQRPGDEEVDLEEQTDGVVDSCHSNAEEIKDSKKNRDSNIGAAIKPCRSKEAKKKRKKEIQNSPEKREWDHQDEIHIISSGDDDCSNEMKKWIMEYHQSRPGLEVLQHQIDDFVTAYEGKLEEEANVWFSDLFSTVTVNSRPIFTATQNLRIEASEISRLACIGMRKCRRDVI